MNNRKKGRVAVLLSGRGSNFESICRYSKREDSNFEVSFVISNKKKALGLTLAENFGIPNLYISAKKFPTRSGYEDHLIKILKEQNIDLICLAGFMKILSERFIDAFRERIVNIHPSLLPSFPGLHAQKQAVDRGVRVSGCTVHFVDTGVDSGPIILQRAVTVDPDDDERSLSEKILKYEHELFPKAIELYFNGSLKISDGKVIIEK